MSTRQACGEGPSAAAFVSRLIITAAIALSCQTPGPNVEVSKRGNIIGYPLGRPTTRTDPRFTDIPSDELRRQRDLWDRSGRRNRAMLADHYGKEWEYRHADAPPLLGIAMSGGGMRSAAFNIGVLKALFEMRGAAPMAGDDGRRLLHEIDVLSSVSGGGYALSWYFLQLYMFMDLETRSREGVEKAMFDADGPFQDHLKENGRLLTRGGNTARYYAAGLTYLLLNVAAVPVNIAANFAVNLDWNTSALRWGYQWGIERAFHRPHNDNPFHLLGARERTSFDELRTFGRQNDLPFFILNATANIDDDLNHSGSYLTNTVFEFTPFDHGSDGFNYMGAPTDISFNEVVGISGAAADSVALPDPKLRILVDAANLDLGHYMKNYNRDQGFATGASRLLPLPLYLFGNNERDVDRASIYLSDGGHAENLGAFSLVRRMCNHIIIVDAESDPEYEFRSYSKLKGALRTELGLDFSVPAIDDYLEHDIHRNLTRVEQSFGAAGNRGSAARRFDASKPVMLGAVKFIPYEPKGVDTVAAKSLRVTYVKLSIDAHRLRDYTPATRSYYRRSVSKFPHQTTADQNYSAEQFEAYRDLGWTIVMRQRDLLLANQSSVWSDRAQTLVHQAALQAKEGRGPRAASLYRKARLAGDRSLEFNPRNSTAHINTGVALIGLGEIDSALKQLDDALELNPRDARALNNKGVAVSMKEEYDEAHLLFDKALQADSQYAHAMYNKACIFAVQWAESEQSDDTLKRSSLAWLERAIQHYSGYGVTASRDRDFEPLWEDADFKVLTELRNGGGEVKEHSQIVNPQVGSER